MRLMPILATATILAAPLATAATKHKSSSHSAAASGAPSCQYESDRTAFDIEGLKSQMMVTALACKQQDKYNAFMSRYQPDVAREEKNLETYFKRAYGRQYQKAKDDYISNLANVQEQDGLKAGNAFCDNLPELFDEVMSLHDSTELHDFANSKSIAQPVAFETCASNPPPPPVVKKPSRRSKKS